MKKQLLELIGKEVRVRIASCQVYAKLKKETYNKVTNYIAETPTSFAIFRLKDIETIENLNGQTTKITLTHTNMKNIPNDVQITEENTEFLSLAIDAAIESGKEIVLIDLFKTKNGDSITINPKNFGKSKISVRVPGGISKFTLNDLRKHEAKMCEE